MNTWEGSGTGMIVPTSSSPLSVGLGREEDVVVEGKLLVDFIEYLGATGAVQKIGVKFEESYRAS